MEAESTAGRESDCRGAGTDGGTGGEGRCEGGVWMGVTETGLEPVCDTGCQLLGDRRGLVGWVALVEGWKRHSGSTAAKLESCWDRDCGVKGVWEDVTRLG